MVTYEWVVETMDVDEAEKINDVVDLCHFDVFAEAQKYAEELRGKGLTVEVGLVRDRWDDFDGDLKDRQWAYLLEDGSLPAEFDDGAKVPKKFHSEVEKTRGTLAPRLTT
jgi:hypothetical protein